jgi:hypothetical protein
MPHSTCQRIMKGIKNRRDTFIDCQDIFCCSFIIRDFCFDSLSSRFLSLLRVASLNSSVHSFISFLQTFSCSGLENMRLTEEVREVIRTQIRSMNTVAPGACGARSQSMNSARATSACDTCDLKMSESPLRKRNVTLKLANNIANTPVAEHSISYRPTIKRFLNHWSLHGCIEPPFAASVSVVAARIGQGNVAGNGVLVSGFVPSQLDVSARDHLDLVDS